MAAFHMSPSVPRVPMARKAVIPAPMKALLGTMGAVTPPILATSLEDWRISPRMLLKKRRFPLLCRATGWA